MGSRPSIMASTQMDSSEPKSISAKSGYQPTVCLKDWWLIRVEADSQGRTLAVAGLTPREHQALRVFRSAPILKVFDVFTLETVDGICVVLRGFINKTRTVENGFPSEVFKHFLFGFPPQWEAFNERCLGRESEEVKDSNNIDQKDHVEATGEEIQELDGRNDCEVEVDLRRDDQSDGEVASEVIVGKKTNKATKASHKPNSTKTSTSIEATGDEIQEHDGRKDYEGEDHLRRDNWNKGEVASEVIVGKKTNKATKSSDKLNSAKASASIVATGDEIQEHDGIKDYEGEDHLRRDNRNDVEVIVGKKTNKATKSSHKLNSTKTSTSIKKKRTADDSSTPHFKSGSESAKNTRRKLAYESPQKEKEAVSVFSPESSSFKRSRSGRLLLPPMAFWRNERAIYDANRGVTAVKQVDLDQDNLSRVSRSDPSRKRRQLR